MSASPSSTATAAVIGDVRVSVTDRCNFRCQYCMPAEGLPWLERDAVLTLRGDRRGSSACSPRWASHDVRLTGGEPLVRRDFPRLAAMLARGPGRRGPLASRPTASCSSATPRRSSTPACSRFNVSIDSLAARPLLRDDPPRRAAAGAARPGGARRASRRRTRSRSTRSRCAASPRTRCCRSREFAREHPYEVRFIEFMPLDADHAWTPEQRPDRRGDPRDHRDRVPARARAARAAARPRASTASPTGRAEIGFINPVSEPFCGDCNRIRLTAEGKLRTCLFSLNETDLRDAAARRRHRRRARAARSATPSGARSSSTTSTSPASSSRRAR